MRKIKINKISCARLYIPPIVFIMRMIYNKTIAREKTPSERARETHSPSRQDAKRTHAPGPHNKKGDKTMSVRAIK